MSKSYANVCLVLISIFLLSGCGFTLRTTKSLPPQLQQVYYQTDNPYGAFELGFKRALKASSVKMLTAPNTTAPVLRVTSTWSPPSTTTSMSSTSGRTYNLNYTAIVSINDASGKLLLSPQTVSVTRDINLQSNEIVEITPQVEIAKQEMQQELSTKILNVLCAKNTFRALAKQ